MLTNAKELKGYKLGARDGEIGRVADFYFDDKFWTLRYLVANTGSWLKNRKTLISPHAFSKINKIDQIFSLNLTKRQIEGSPPLDTNLPVSKQYQESYMGYYGYPIYWYGSYPWGASPVVDQAELIENQKENHWDPHLRSANEVADYKIHARDGEIGHVVDFIIEDESYAIRYLVVEAGNWFSRKKVLVSPQWIEKVESPNSEVFTSLSREEIKDAPVYIEGRAVCRDYESGLFDHYGYEGYWVEGSAPLDLRLLANKMKVQSADQLHYR
jgi:uncharacterized protein YrrD